MAKTNKMAKTLIITQLGVLSALIVVMTFVPYIGYISYGALSITLLHIPVIIGACVLGAKGGATLGAVWGITCIIKAIMAPPSPLEGIIFRNPIVALIPRVLAGLVAGLIFDAMSKKVKTQHIGSIVAALAACLCNTILVMGGIYLFYGESQLGMSEITFGGLTNYILAAFTLNAFIEIAVAVILTVPVSHALRKIRIKI